MNTATKQPRAENANKHHWTEHRLPLAMTCLITSFLDCKSHSFGMARVASWTRNACRHPSSWIRVLKLKHPQSVIDLYKLGLHRVDHLEFDEMVEQSLANEAIRAWGATLTRLDLSRLRDFVRRDDNLGVSESWETALSACHNLTTLIGCHIPMADWRFVRTCQKALPKLVNLNLAQQGFDVRLFQAVGGLPRLEKLDCEWSSLSNMAAETGWCDFNLFAVFPHLFQLHIHSTWISWMSIRGQLTSAQMPRLQRLALSGHMSFRVSDVSVLTQFIDSGLVNQLTDLQINITPVSGGGVTDTSLQLAPNELRSESLRRVCLCWHALTVQELDVTELLRNMPRLQTLACGWGPQDQGPIENSWSRRQEEPKNCLRD